MPLRGRRRRNRSMVAMPSTKSIRRQRPSWEEYDPMMDDVERGVEEQQENKDNQAGWSAPPPPPTSSSSSSAEALDDNFDASFLSEYGSSLMSHLNSSKIPKLSNNNQHWGLRDVQVERSLQISPPVINFGDVQRGAVSKKKLRLHNCTGHIARARVVPFKAYALLTDEENYLKSEPNVARISAGLSIYVTITCIGRGLGKFKEILQIYVSEHDLIYEIPIMGNVLAEDGFEDAIRRNQLARKMKNLEINLLEKTNEHPFASLIPSSELTIDESEVKKISLGNILSQKNKNDKNKISSNDYPSFPNVRWSTLTNSLCYDHRRKWKIEPDPSVSVDVIKKRYESMIIKSKSKWANVEGRFHLAKMISKVSGITPRTGVLASSRKEKRSAKSAATIAFGIGSSTVDDENASKKTKINSTVSIHSSRHSSRELSHDNTTTKLKNESNSEAPTVDMSIQQRKEADRKTETKLLGELGIKKSIENPEDALANH